MPTQFERNNGNETITLSYAVIFFFDFLRIHFCPLCVVRLDRTHRIVNFIAKRMRS